MAEEGLDGGQRETPGDEPLGVRVPEGVGDLPLRLRLLVCEGVVEAGEHEPQEDVLLARVHAESLAGGFG